MCTKRDQEWFLYCCTLRGGVYLSTLGINEYVEPAGHIYVDKQLLGKQNQNGPYNFAYFFKKGLRTFPTSAKMEFEGWPNLFGGWDPRSIHAMVALRVGF